MCTQMIHLVFRWCVFVQKPDRDDWSTGLEAMQAALQLEKSINQSLLDLHKCSEVNGDAEVTSLPPPLSHGASLRACYA